jgi:putative endonuclease
LDKSYYVYIMTNRYNDVFYTGITNDLKRRVIEHKSKEKGGLTARYGVTKLVYYEVYEDVLDAIAREKQIKGGSRLKKLKPVDSINEEWVDLVNCI